MPDVPSYFLKPLSSLAGDGAPVVRPRGTELLTFEGEIALIIGRRASTSPRRRRSRTSAGSRRRTTSGSTTCAGPTAARTCSPRARTASRRSARGPGRRARPRRPDAAHARQRRGRPGGLERQPDLRLRALVADLSRFMTLEPGDVILTGTPGGLGLVEPGDRSRSSSPASARCATRSSRPTRRRAVRRAAEVGRDARGGARRQRAAAGHAPTPRWAALRRSRPRRSRCSSPGAGSATRSSPALRPTRPDMRLLGYAYTLRYVPLREDVRDADTAELNAQKRRSSRSARRGARDRRPRRARRRHDRRHPRRPRAGPRRAGIVTDGGLRDRDAVARWTSRPTTRRRTPRCSAAPLPARGQRPGRLRRRARDARRRDRRRRRRRARPAGGARRGGRRTTRWRRSCARRGRSSASRPASRCAASTRSRKSAAPSTRRGARATRPRPGRQEHPT